MLCIPITTITTIISSSIKIKRSGKPIAMSSSGNGSFHPKPAVVFTPDANGMMQANSLGSLMNMKMQQIVYERELANSQPVRKTEAQRQERRQANLDRALARVRQDQIKMLGVDKEPRFMIEREKGAIMAPHLASPQPIFSSRNTPKDKLEGRRQEQIRSLHPHSFVAICAPKICKAIDNAIALCDEREDEVLARRKSQKNLKSLSSDLKRFFSSDRRVALSTADWLYVTSPLEEAVEKTNAGLARSGIPLRVHFRKVWETPDQFAPRLYMIYPDTDLDYKGGIKKWEGIDEAIDRHGNPVLQN